MSIHTTPQGLIVHITVNEKGNPPGKLADAEIHFCPGGDEANAASATARGAVRQALALDGLKLIGFAIWERKGGGSAGRNVTFPARQYSVNGERRSFALLRPTHDHPAAQETIRQAILAAYEMEIGGGSAAHDEEPITAAAYNAPGRLPAFQWAPEAE